MRKRFSACLVGWPKKTKIWVKHDPSGTFSAGAPLPAPTWLSFEPFFSQKWNLEHRPFRMVISMEFLIHPHPLRDGFPGISAAKASQHKTRLAWKQRFFMYSSHVTLWNSSSFMLQKPRNEQ